MKIGDIVVTLAGRKATIVSKEWRKPGYYWYTVKHEHELVENQTHGMHEAWLAPVNCSIGKVWDRYAPRTLYSDYHDIVDRYTGKIVGKFRSHD